MKNSMFKKMFIPYVLKRVYMERLGEPLIYNIISLYYFFFGKFSEKVEYDLVPREPYAFGILEAAKQAKKIGLDGITVIEFGVAAGGGLFNMCYIAKEVSKEIGINIQILGFDSGAGMPSPIDWRDQPDKYFTGDYPMPEIEKLKSALPPNCSLVLGPINETVKNFESNLKFPIGFISVDVDYYSSTIDCLGIFNLAPSLYLKYVYTYFDDIYDIDDNEHCGELLAINHFNNTNTLRKLVPATMLTQKRIFRRSHWVKQIYLAHIFDHEHRSIQYVQNQKIGPDILINPFL